MSQSHVLTATVTMCSSSLREESNNWPWEWLICTGEGEYWIQNHTNLLALWYVHQNAQKANFRVTETCWGGQITCNGAQDSSRQRGRQAISRSISSKESNRSIIFRNLSRKIHIFRRCYITQLICNTCVTIGAIHEWIWKPVFCTFSRHAVLAII